MSVVSVAHIIDVAEPFAMVVLMDDGTPYQTAFHWFSDELSFTEDEVIGPHPGGVPSAASRP